MPHPRSAPWLAAALLPVVVTGFAAVWTLASLYAGRQCSFLAVVGAIDVLWVLGLAPALRPDSRAAIALLGAAATVALANWSIAAVQVGAPVGIGPLESLGRLGPRHAWTMIDLANDWRDAVWIALALAVAGGWPWLSARRRPGP